MFRAAVSHVPTGQLSTPASELDQAGTELLHFFVVVIKQLQELFGRGSPEGLPRDVALAVNRPHAHEPRVRLHD